MYPYQLNHNPFPNTPTPSEKDARILGGKKHIDAKHSIISCINDLSQNVKLTNTNNEFRIITIIQDVGSGKTHLTIHLKVSDVKEKAIFSYIDLSKVYPKNIQSIYQSMIYGFEKDYLNTLRKELLYYILDKSRRNKKLAKKIFRLGLLESLSGKGIESKALLSVENKLDISIKDIDSLFIEEFSENDIKIIKKIIQNRFESLESITMLEMINRLTLLSRLNLLLFNKISIFQFDEFDAESNTLSLVKALINTHLPNTILMMNLTPYSYNKIGRTDGSVYDRLEKANYKIDLAGSNSFEEISEIVMEYLFYNDHISGNQEIVRRNLIAILKILYDDFDFRNIRSILNIMHNTFEIARQKNISSINEECIDESLKIVYPGMKIKGSIMNISISEYIKIKSYLTTDTNLENEIVSSIQSLLESLEHHGSPISNRTFSRSDIDISYSELVNTTKSANINATTALVLNEQLSSDYDSMYLNKKQNKLYTPSTISHEKPKIWLDRSKIIDLLYYYHKLKDNVNTLEDDERALILAKSLNLK
ncbi:MAG: hypothetical protein ACE5SW_00910 [Nitrososphaeraceae archaeon]